MNVLAMETSTDVFSIGVQAENTFYEKTVKEGLKHSEKLVPQIQALLAEAGVKAEDLDLILCGKGPGSFTGLRIGMSTAKGLAMGAGCPLISLPTLDIFAYPYSFFDGIVVPVIDARKKRFYTAFYQSGEILTDYMDITPGKMLEKLEDHSRILFTGPDCSLFFSIMQKGVYFDRTPKSGYIESMMKMGIRRFEEEGKGDSDDSGPIYIRKSEAEEALDSSKGS